MAMKRCPVCGEKYSDTYRDCPFCEEEEVLQDGGQLRRGGGRRAARGGSILTPVLVVLIVLMAALLIYLLYGDKLKEGKGGQDQPDTPIEDVTPGGQDTQDPSTEPETPEPPDEDPEGSQGVMPNEPEGGDTPQGTTVTDYDKAMALPNGLILSTTDFTLKGMGDSHTIAVSGGSGSYTWISEDGGVASVDASGKVVAVSNGTVNVVVTDGSKKGVCIVRVNAAGTTAPSGTDTTPSGGTLKAGAAQVINGGNGVRVRSGPGTDTEILASLPNGASVKIVESAGNGWYKITFDDVGGVSTPGYMKGEFLQNK